MLQIKCDTEHYKYQAFNRVHRTIKMAPTRKHYQYSRPSPYSRPVTRQSDAPAPSVYELTQAELREARLAAAEAKHNGDIIGWLPPPNAPVPVVWKA